MGETVEVWRGSVAAWECDAMGHLNVGFYLAKAMEALVVFAAELGMPHAFAPHAEATLVLREQHIRFRREARAGARLYIEAGVLEMGEDEARLLFLMRHDDGAIAASFQMLVAHATVRDSRAFPWPAWARSRGEELKIELPEEAAPRSLPVGPGESQASLPRALALGLKRTGMGAIRPADCDPFGRMRAETVIARISDCATHLFVDLLSGVAGDRVGVVMLEYRLVYLAWPKLGDRFELRSGFSAAESRVRRMVHWFLDPATGRPWAAAEAASAAFDLNARKTILLTEKELIPWSEATTVGLTI